MARTKNKRWELLDKAFISAAITVALVEFSQVGSGLIDGIMTSRMLGSDAMAAVGIGHPLFSIVGIISGIIAVGMQSTSAKEIGRGSFRRFNEITTMSFAVAAALSLLFTAIVLTFSGPLTGLLGARGNSAELFELTRVYIVGLSVGIPGLILGPVLAPAIQLDNGGSLVRRAALIGAAADVVLDWAAVKLNLGIWGMGIATSVSGYVNLAILLLHFRKKDRMLHISFNLKSFSSMKAVLTKGATMAVRRLANVLRPLLINNYIIALGGTAAMSALAVKNNLNNFTEIVGSGIAGAVPLMMSVVYGEKSLEDLLHIGKLTHKTIFIGTGTVAVVSAVFASPIASFFVGKNSEIHSLVVFAIYMMAAELVVQTLISSRISYLNVISKHFDSRLLQLALKLLAIVPSVLVMGKLFGVYGVLSSFAVAYVLLVIIIFGITAFRKKSVRVTPMDYLRLDCDFEVEPGDVIELDIRDAEDAALVSEQLQMFCRGHKLDERKTYISALALEETATLIFENNNFDPKLSIDLRVVIKDGDIILRIRDNGKSSIPFGEYNPEESDDPCDKIGIRILQKTAKDINYYHTLKINYTVITL